MLSSSPEASGRDVPNPVPLKIYFREESSPAQSSSVCFNFLRGQVLLPSSYTEASGSEVADEGWANPSLKSAKLVCFPTKSAVRDLFTPGL